MAFISPSVLFPLIAVPSIMTGIITQSNLWIITTNTSPTKPLILDPITVQESFSDNAIEEAVVIKTEDQKWEENKKVEVVKSLQSKQIHNAKNLWSETSQKVTKKKIETLKEEKFKTVSQEQLNGLQKSFIDLMKEKEKEIVEPIDSADLVSFKNKTSKKENTEAFVEMEQKSFLDFLLAYEKLLKLKEEYAGKFESLKEVEKPNYVTKIPAKDEKSTLITDFFETNNALSKARKINVFNWHQKWLNKFWNQDKPTPIKEFTDPYLIEVYALDEQYKKLKDAQVAFKTFDWAETSNCFATKKNALRNFVLQSKKLLILLLNLVLYDNNENNDNASAEEAKNVNYCNKHQELSEDFKRFEVEAAAIKQLIDKNNEMGQKNALSDEIQKHNGWGNLEYYLVALNNFGDEKTQTN